MKSEDILQRLQLIGRPDAVRQLGSDAVHPRLRAKRH